MCMAPGGTEMTPDRTQKCLMAASSMKAHSFVASELVTALEKVKAAKLMVEGHAQTAAEELNEWIREEAAYEFLNMNIGEDEGKLLKKFADQTAKIGGGSPLTEKDLENAIDWVLEKGTQLEGSLVKMKAETEEFLDECAVLTTGYDAEKHYMFDLCRVAGSKCLHQENAVRAVCCCGYSPLTAYGSSPSLAATIPGLPTSRRMSEALPEVASEPLPSVCDMAEDGCSEVWTRASLVLTRLGRQQLITRENNRAKAAYNLCPNESSEGSIEGSIEVGSNHPPGAGAKTEATSDGATSTALSEIKVSEATSAALSAIAGCFMLFVGAH